jgi:hypothetical protein
MTSISALPSTLSSVGAVTIKEVVVVRPMMEYTASDPKIRVSSRMTLVITLALLIDLPYRRMKKEWVNDLQGSVEKPHV